MVLQSACPSEHVHHKLKKHLRVTDPPAVENPPSTLLASTISHLELAPANGCHTLISPKLNCMMGQRPNSSDHGAHSSHPNAYVIKNAAMPSRARVMP